MVDGEVLMLYVSASVLDKTEYICQNDLGDGTAEAHAEVIDPSIRMLKNKS